MAKKRTMDNPNNKVPFFENYFNTSDINSPFVQQSIGLPNLNLWVFFLRIEQKSAKTINK